MPTVKASGIPEKLGPVHGPAVPKDSFRNRLVQSFLGHGFTGLFKLAATMARIWMDRILVEVSSRLPFAYQRWQMEFEKSGPPARPGNASPARVAFVYPDRGENHLLPSTNSSKSLAFIHSAQPAQDTENLRYIWAKNDADFLNRCYELAYREGIEWLVFTHPHAEHPVQLATEILSLDETTQCAYWDEDWVTPDGRRTKPFFKPAWSPELWLGLDILDTFALRTRCFAQALPQPSLAHLKAWLAGMQEPAHIARVLTHLKPARPAENPSRLDRHAQSVSVYLDKLGLRDIHVQSEDGGVVKATWAVQAEKVSIIIPTRDNLVFLRRCVETLLEKTNYADYEIILVDNHSTSEDVLGYYREILAHHPNIHVLPYDQAFNFSAACNLGAAAAQGNLLLFLNNDVEIIEPGWLEEMVRLAQLPGVGIVGARLFYPDGRLQHAGIVVGMTGHANHVDIKGKLWRNSPYGPANMRRNCSAVTGACMLIRSDVFRTIQGFREDYRLVFNDVEICLRTIRAGWRVVMTPYANLVHYEGRSRSTYIPPEDMRLAQQDSAVWIENGDPFYNPHLSRAVTRPVFRSRLEMPARQRMETITRMYSGGNA